MGIPLTPVKKGAETPIVQVDGKEEVRHHLEDMGFIPGANVTIVSASSDNAIVSIKEPRVVISKKMTNKIMV